MRFIFLSALLTHAAAQGNTENIVDPIKSFCRRHQHQTCVIDNKLYVDGGLAYYGSDIQPNTSPQTNTWLIYEDVSNPTPDFPQLYSNLTKESEVPSVSGGILWPDPVNKLFYQYGGQYTNSEPQGFSTLWLYDTVYNTWNRSTSSDASQSQISWPAFGAGTTTDEGIGYYYGGYLSANSVSGWTGDSLMLNSIVSYDMNRRTWKNYTYDSTPRAEGTLKYIPAGERGMLIYFGGIETINGQQSYANMSQIHLLDIANNKWYTQTASGDIPQARRAFCAGVVWAPDQSSYNIYVFGGIGAAETALGDVWVLSLPSFTWIYWYTTPKATTFPGGKAWASCDVVYKSQMIVMSGFYTNTSRPACDAPSIGGQHGLALGQEGKNTPWLGLMTNVTEYRVPDNITDIIGGGTDGDATLTAPVSGWATNDLSVYFKTSYAAVSRAATRSIPLTNTVPTTPPATTSTSASSAPAKTNIGAIVGGVVGGVVFLVVIILIALICLRSRRRAREQHERPQNELTDQTVERTPAEKSVANFSMSQGSTLHSPQPSYSVQGSPPPPSDYQFYTQQNPQPWENNGIYAYSTNQPNYQQTYYPPPSDPSQSPRSASALGIELPTTQTPANVELPEVRSPVPFRGTGLK